MIDLILLASVTGATILILAAWILADLRAEGRTYLRARWPREVTLPGPGRPAPLPPRTPEQEAYVRWMLGADYAGMDMDEAQRRWEVTPR